VTFIQGIYRQEVAGAGKISVESIPRMGEAINYRKGNLLT